MYVDSATYLSHGKPYKRHLLRHSYRKEGKVKKKTIASLCGLSEEEVSAVKLALKHKKDLQSLQRKFIINFLCIKLVKAVTRKLELFWSGYIAHLCRHFRILCKLDKQLGLSYHARHLRKFEG